MQAVGIVVEYNPFHNGHLLHIKKSKEKTGAEVVVAVMSGSFLQRGEPALVNKWTRTEMALSGGADIVIELPYFFATANAEVFARGAIHLLEVLQCQDFCFGSEAGTIEPFLRTIEVKDKQKDQYEASLKQYLHKGNSYPKAASLAFHSLASDQRGLDLTKPNNILGLEYIQSVVKNQYQINPQTIQRVSASYHETALSNTGIASATGIRKALFEGENSIQKIQDYVPKSTADILTDYLLQYKHFQNWELYWPYLQYQIISTSLHSLSRIHEVEEGIEYRIVEMAKKSAAFYEFMQNMKTKRYTWTRIQRIATHILTQTKKEEVAQSSFPEYIRLLGMTKNGQTYLNKIKKQLELPLVAKISSFEMPMLAADIKAANIHGLGVKKNQQHLIKREYLPPIIKK